MCVILTAKENLLTCIVFCLFPTWRVHDAILLCFFSLLFPTLMPIYICVCVYRFKQENAVNILDKQAMIASEIAIPFCLRQISLHGSRIACTKNRDAASARFLTSNRSSKYFYHKNNSMHA